MGAYFQKQVVDDAHQVQKLFVLVFEAVPKGNGTDDVGDGVVDGEGGVEGRTWSAGESLGLMTSLLIIACGVS